MSCMYFIYGIFLDDVSRSRSPGNIERDLSKGIAATMLLYLDVHTLAMARLHPIHQPSFYQPQVLRAEVPDGSGEIYCIYII